MYKWGLAPSLNCECGATEQTADHVISSCLIHHVLRGIRGLQALDDANLGNAAARGGKRLDPRPGLNLCWPRLSLGA